MTDAEPELNVLALNSGSSSLKFGLYCAGSSRIEMLLSGEAESIGDKSGKCHAEDSHGNALLAETGPIPSQREAIIRIGKLLIDAKMPVPDAIGHRIVHGGPKLRQHCLIDDSVLTQLESGDRLRAAAYSIGSVGHPFRTRAFSAASAGGVFRHDLSRRIAGGRAGTSNCQGIAIGRNSTVRISRPLVRIDCASTCQRSTEPSRDCPSRQWRERDRGQSRQIDRHQHGIDPNRRSDHGHAERRSRSRRSGLSDA